jgi:hypothetical protein
MQCELDRPADQVQSQSLSLLMVRLVTSHSDHGLLLFVVWLVEVSGWAGDGGVDGTMFAGSAFVASSSGRARCAL